MTNQTIISELDEYCAAVGLTPSTVCRNATGNPRLRERLIARMEKTDEYILSLRRWMDENPVDGENKPATNEDSTKNAIAPSNPENAGVSS